MEGSDIAKVHVSGFKPAIPRTIALELEEPNVGIAVERALASGGHLEEMIPGGEAQVPLESILGREVAASSWKGAPC